MPRDDWPEQIAITKVASLEHAGLIRLVFQL
jgi:hypothetical protein